MILNNWRRDQTRLMVQYKNRTPIGNICSDCNTDTNGLTRFPIMSNESFSVDNNNERETELSEQEDVLLVINYNNNTPTYPRDSELAIIYDK